VQEGEADGLVERRRMTSHDVVHGRTPRVTHRSASAAARGETAELGDGEGEGQRAERTRQESIPRIARPMPRCGEEDAEGDEEQREATRHVQEDVGVTAHEPQVEQRPTAVREDRPAREGQHESCDRRRLGLAPAERRERRPERRPQGRDVDTLEAHGAGSDANGVPLR
jgi:hypothetical protein